MNFFPSQAHGELDEVVSYKRGQLTAEVVERLSKRHKFITYPNMGHEGTLVSMSLYKDFDSSHVFPQEELEDVKQFILQEMS